MGFEHPDDVIGHSMLDETIPKKDYVITEYMGPGCPDLLSRPIWFSIRDKRYAIGYKVGIYQEFEDGELCEVYDMEKDPCGFYNVVKSIRHDDLHYLLRHIKDRFEEVKDDTAVFIERIEKS